MEPRAPGAQDEGRRRRGRRLIAVMKTRRSTMSNAAQTPFPRRLALAIAVASAAVTVAVGVTIGSLTGYLGAERAPAPLAEPLVVPAAGPVLAPEQPAELALAEPAYRDPK